MFHIKNKTAPLEKASVVYKEVNIDTKQAATSQNNSRNESQQPRTS